MLTKENVKQLVRGFLHEACGYLGINDTQISIGYMPMPVSMMMVMLLKDSDDIVIDNKLLADVVEQNTYTKLRFEIYRVTREIYQRRKHQAEGTQEDIKADVNDAYAFAYALIFLNGLRMIIPLYLTRLLMNVILEFFTYSTMSFMRIVCYILSPIRNLKENFVIVQKRQKKHVWQNYIYIAKQNL